VSKTQRDALRQLRKELAALIARLERALDDDGQPDDEQSPAFYLVQDDEI
jgi:hypothetical protein